ncbi:Actin-related protein 6 [Acorus gramineus]|uniref:Actin-related protein 6 n=1 Tax=Acorus gramineus TaxID=55184 RepID=A0AAV9AND1_ACOGR|nr:Actin-related protein 6 [Acorus gramineus]
MGSHNKVVVLDNGGGLLKAGIGGDHSPTAVVPNCLGRPPSSKKWLSGDQLLSSDDHTSVSLRRPLDRGYLVNPDLQKEIWDRVLHHLLLLSDDDLRSSSLLLVEPLLNLPSARRASDELVFEDFGFSSLYVADPPSLVHLHHHHHHHCSLVVDCGFSFAHAAPVLEGFTLNYGVRRLDIGGKALTNHLKELVSYRSINVMDETLLIDQAKERLCFVSLDVPRDLRLSRIRGRDNPFRCTYVLPDGVNHMRGFVKDEEEAQRYLSLPPEGEQDARRIEDEVMDDAQRREERKRSILAENEFSLTNERFLVPEMLFHPADLGMNEAGLAECIVRSVDACHPYLHPVLFESIVLSGGSTLFPRFAERLERELRPLVCDDYKVKITTQEDPILGVWRGGSLLASTPDFEAMCVTKVEYEEYGSTRCRRRFFH